MDNRENIKNFTGYKAPETVHAVPSQEYSGYDIPPYGYHAHNHDIPPVHEYTDPKHDDTHMQNMYTLRRLQSKDVFQMSRIISKIGIEEFKECFSSPSVMAAVQKMSEEKASSDDLLDNVGITVVLDLASIIVSNLPKVENEVYSFLSQLSGIDAKSIAELDASVFFSMIVDVIKKPEFKDFIGVASRLFK